MKSTTGILLVNLGTPLSPSPKDVHRYLIEFLTDERVLDMPWLKRQLLVRGLIVPTRLRQSAKSYQEIWTEKGSPLMVHGKNLQTALQHSLGNEFMVELAMRYQQPSIKNGINKLLEADVDHLIVLPLFPQYASATTGSVHQAVQNELSKLQVIPKVTLINQFATFEPMIQAFCQQVRKFPLQDYDHILLSFHGLPQSQLLKADSKAHCKANAACCMTLQGNNRNCYSAQCYATAKAIVENLKLSPERYTVCFQSRLGKEPWIEPYTSTTIHQMAELGKKKILVLCPAFVCDCLETIYEIGVEYAQEFKKAGGQALDLVPGLNDSPLWIEALKQLVLNNTLA